MHQKMCLTEFFFFSVHVGVYMIHFLTPNSYAVTTKIVFACIKKQNKTKKNTGTNLPVTTAR